MIKSFSVLNYEKLNRTRIHLILFSPFYLSMLIAGIKGWQSPISCEDVPARISLLPGSGILLRGRFWRMAVLCRCSLK